MVTQSLIYVENIYDLLSDRRELQSVSCSFNMSSFVRVGSPTEV